MMVRRRTARSPCAWRRGIRTGREVDQHGGSGDDPARSGELNCLSSAISGIVNR